MLQRVRTRAGTLPRNLGLSLFYLMAKPLNPTDGFIIHGWMVTDLGLAGYELVVFAVVHQFSQSKAGFYTGGVRYLCDWLQCSDNTARKYLHQLEEKGLITAMRGEVNGVQFCNYQSAVDAPQNLRGGTSKFAGGVPQNLRGVPQNLQVDNNIENKSDNNSPFFDKKERVGARARFVPPTLDEVSDFIREKGVDVDPEAFHAFYTSNGWKVGGRAPMKDWHAAVTTWAKRNRSAKPNTPPPTPSPQRQEKEDVFVHNMRVVDRLTGSHHYLDYIRQKNGGHVDEQ